MTLLLEHKLPPFSCCLPGSEQAFGLQPSDIQLVRRGYQVYVIIHKVILLPYILSRPETVATVPFVALLESKGQGAGEIKRQREIGLPGNQRQPHYGNDQSPKLADRRGEPRPSFPTVKQASLAQ
jgi:hypothetical protein